MGSRVQLHLTSLHPANRALRALEAQGMLSWRLHRHEQSVFEAFQEESRHGGFQVGQKSLKRL